jgi:hypothetical protein
MKKLQISSAVALLIGLVTKPVRIDTLQRLLAEREEAATRAAPCQ